MPTNSITDKQDELIANASRIGNAPKMNKIEADKILSDLDYSKITAEAADKIESAKFESLSNERADREPLPGAYANAFNKEPLVVKTSIGDVTIRNMVLYDINVFRLIDSPFYRIIMGDSALLVDNKNSLFSTEEEAIELIYQFTHPVKEVYKLFKQGKEAFKDKVMEEVAFVYNPIDAALLVEKIMMHVFDVQMAKVGFEAPPETEDGSSDTKKN
jgi:hypothetical protein